MALLLTAASAHALRLQVGDLVIEAEGGFAPKALPKTENAPITLHGGGKLSIHLLGWDLSVRHLPQAMFGARVGRTL